MCWFLLNPHNLPPTAFKYPRIMSTSFLGSPFILLKQHSSSQYPALFRKLQSLTMAACLQPSRAQNPVISNPKGPQIDDHFLKYCRPNYQHLISCRPSCSVEDEDEEDELWGRMKKEARMDIQQEPVLSGFYSDSILSHHCMRNALANCLSLKLSNVSLPSYSLYDVFIEVLSDDPEILLAVREDLRAVKERDPACLSYVHCFLNFKGFLACQAHRIAHRLWSNGRKILALLIQNRVSEVFSVDIHPGAKIGRGILLDHATGVVIGETAVIGNNVSILHNVTLGGTGKACGDRHPKIGDGVLIGAGTCVLGNVRIGDGAKIGAGSVVIKEVPARTTAVGNPARLLGGKENPLKLDKIPSFTMDHTSNISGWSDYVI